MLRTHTCGELRKAHTGKEVVLAGWADSVRVSGKIGFIILRDRYGTTQCFIGKQFLETLKTIRKDSVLQIKGKVNARPEKQVKKEMLTGEIELEATELKVLAMAEPLPLDENATEDTRLKYRYLDLRKEKLQWALKKRHEALMFIREFLSKKGFLEITTPMLTKSTPEGARDFLVPSRIYPGKFFALPQSPQQYKQLLMVAGFDKYFQIAPCFRDEDARADRSPGEFYQLDIEMSFATQEDIFSVVEGVLTETFREYSDSDVTEPPFPRIPYAEAMLKYGTDKPDLRIPIEIVDTTDIFTGSGFKAFAGAIDKGAVVRALKVAGISGKPRSFFDRLIEYAQSIGSKGLAYLIYGDEEVKGPIAKFLDDERMAKLRDLYDAESGDVAFFVCDVDKQASRIAGEVRLKLGHDLELIEAHCFKFCWVVDYPMFELDPETKKIEFSHNPFSMPQGGMEDLESKNPLDVLAFQYDIVCNGVELSSGAIRNHRPDIMYRAFEIAGYDKHVVDTKFPALINAFRYGAPPHGGLAPGIDRIVRLLAGEKNLREVIAFPMNQHAQDLMMNAPNEVTEAQLEELYLKLVPPIEDD